MGQRLILVVGVLAGGAAAWSAPNAGAYNPRVNGCHDRYKTYQFDHRYGEDWKFGSTSLDDAVHAGIQRLNNPRAQNGTSIASMSRLPNLTSGSPTADVLISRVAMSGAGLATCGGNGSNTTGDAIKISAALTNTTALEFWGAHEMLHLAGMEHGGKRDSFLPGYTGPQQVPTRSSSCVTSADTAAYTGLSVDDIALMGWLHDPAAERQVTADSGFEFGYNTWDIVSTPTFQRVAISGASGNYRQKVKNSSFSLQTSFVQQRTGILTGDTRPQYRASADVRRRSSSYDLDTSIRLLTRYADFGGNNDCEYESAELNGVDPNSNANYAGMWTDRGTSTTHNHPTGWRPINTPWFTVHEWHRVDVAVRLTARSKLGGTGASTYFWLDNLTVEQN